MKIKIYSYKQATTLHETEKVCSELSFDIQSIYAFVYRHKQKK
jgi:hypothetical protein